MELQTVVARFRNNTILKGKTRDFFPTKPHFNLDMFNGEIISIDMKQLKAVFFVKDCEGDKNRKDNYGDVITGGGLKIKVKFYDGELVTGYSLSYFVAHHGFFMTPADLRCNNERIFVVTSAVEDVEFL